MVESDLGNSTSKIYLEILQTMRKNRLMLDICIYLTLKRLVHRDIVRPT